MSREAFEKWMLDSYEIRGSWNKQRMCYEEFPIQLAWAAWNNSDLISKAGMAKAGEVGWQLREVYFDDFDGELLPIAYRSPYQAQRDKLRARRPMDVDRVADALRSTFGMYLGAEKPEAAELAEVFWGMDADEQAIFFSQRGEKAKHMIVFQLQAVTDSDHLTIDGRYAMSMIGDYAQKVTT